MTLNVYIQKSSIIHNLNFWTKLLCLSLILPLTVFVSPVKWLPALFFFFIIVFMLSKISFSKFWKTTKLYIVSITIGLLILSLFFTAGAISERIFSGLILALRFALLISFGILFSLVTNPIEIPAGFMQIKIPHKFGVTLMVAYRMMPLLSQKLKTIVEAQKARGASFRLSFKKPNKFFFQLTSFAIPLLHATLEMSVRLSDALISRGYDPEGKITVPEAKWEVFDFVLISFSLLLLVVNILV